MPVRRSASCANRQPSFMFQPGFSGGVRHCPGNVAAPPCRPAETANGIEGRPVGRPAGRGLSPRATAREPARARTARNRGRAPKPFVALPCDGLAGAESRTYTAAPDAAVRRLQSGRLISCASEPCHSPPRYLAAAQADEPKPTSPRRRAKTTGPSQQAGPQTTTYSAASSCSPSSPARIFSAMRPEFCRMAASIRAAISGFCLRKTLAFSRPCPTRWLS
jgi:hypothetical protein